MIVKSSRTFIEPLFQTPVLTWYSAGDGVESEFPGAVRAHHRVGQRHEVLRRPEPVLKLVLGEGLVLLLQLQDSVL